MIALSHVRAALLAAMVMIFLPSTAFGASCPLGNRAPVSDANGVAKVCNSQGHVLTVREFPPNKVITENRLFWNMICPTMSGFVEPHKPWPRERAWPKGVTPMHFVCDAPMQYLDGRVVPLPRNVIRRN